VPQPSRKHPTDDGLIWGPPPVASMLPGWPRRTSSLLRQLRQSKFHRLPVYGLQEGDEISFLLRGQIQRFDQRAEVRIGADTVEFMDAIVKQGLSDLDSESPHRGNVAEMSEALFTFTNDERRIGARD
jgi:hypothetical protein